MADTEDFTPKNIFLTGGAGKLRLLATTDIYPIVVIVVIVVLKESKSKMTVS